MSPAKRAAYGSLGGEQAQLLGKAYRFSSEKAREAGRKGGLARAARMRAKQQATDSQIPKDSGQVKSPVSDQAASVSESSGR
jgi:hypothetical protein